jgi:hypothetical protein
VGRRGASSPVWPVCLVLPPIAGSHTALRSGLTGRTAVIHLPSPDQGGHPRLASRNAPAFRSMVEAVGAPAGGQLVPMAAGSGPGVEGKPFARAAGPLGIGTPATACGRKFAANPCRFLERLRKSADMRCDRSPTEPHGPVISFGRATGTEWLNSRFQARSANLLAMKNVIK